MKMKLNKLDETVNITTGKTDWKRNGKCADL